MKKNSKSIGGIKREYVLLSAGFCLGMSVRENMPFTKHDRKILKMAGKALRAACVELWPEWFK
jgi:hypothetical protein